MCTLDKNRIVVLGGWCCSVRCCNLAPILLVSRDFGANDSWLVFIFAGSFWPFAFKIFGLYLEAFKFLIAIFLHLLKEKAPYEAKAAKKKADYEKLMTAYNKKQVNHLTILIAKSFSVGIYWPLNTFIYAW